MMNGETYSSLNGDSQPRNIGFYAKECLGPEITSATLPWTRLRQKSWFGWVYFFAPMAQCFIMENGPTVALDCSRQY